ncbi:hypothetical protein ACP70R_049505 [Stipagrostis hirtigluma subsp. patula]
MAVAQGSGMTSATEQVSSDALNPRAREFLPWWRLGGSRKLLSADTPEFVVPAPGTVVADARGDAAPGVIRTGRMDRDWMYNDKRHVMEFRDGVKQLLIAAKEHMEINMSDLDKTTPAEQAMALHIIRHHLSTTLKNEYMTERNPKVLWNLLHERFEKIEIVLLPRVKREWANLRFQEFKTVEDYNTALYGITTRMKLCGLKLEDKDLIEKTLSTFHPKLTYISRQYKKDNYKKYVDLSNAMQQDQGEDETIMQNQLSRPTGTVATPEENATSLKNKKDIKGKGSQKDSNGMAPKANNFKKKKEWKSKKKTPQGPKYGEQDQECYKCGMRGHWSRICKTPKHIVEMLMDEDVHGDSV